MIDAELIEKLASTLAKHVAPRIPITIDLWDCAIIASYLKRDAATVRDRIACLPEFPKAIRLPTTRGRAQPLYKAIEVIAWVEKYQEKN